MIQRPLSSSAFRIGFALALAGSLAACSSINNASHKVVDAITPYRVEVVQGNFVSKEQVQALQPGMSREQVRSILGSPLVTSVFHADRWDYVFTIKRRGVDIENKKLTVYFSGFALERVEGDEMPSEKEFVAELASRNRIGKIPRLEATPDELKRYAPKDPASQTDDANGNTTSDAAPQPTGNYPPLEQR